MVLKSNCNLIINICKNNYSASVTIVFLFHYLYCKLINKSLVYKIININKCNNHYIYEHYTFYSLKPLLYYFYVWDN